MKSIRFHQETLLRNSELVIRQFSVWLFLSADGGGVPSLPANFRRYHESRSTGSWWANRDFISTRAVEKIRQPEGRSELRKGKERETGIAALFRCSVTQPVRNAVAKTTMGFLKPLSGRWISLQIAPSCSPLDPRFSSLGSSTRSLGKVGRRGNIKRKPDAEMKTFGIVHVTPVRAAGPAAPPYPCRRGAALTCPCC